MTVSKLAMCSSRELPSAYPRVERSEGFSGGSLTGVHRALHVAAPGQGRLGRGPLDRTNGCRERRPEVDPAAGSRIGVVAASRPLLVGPATLDDEVWPSGPGAEVPGQLVPERGVAPVGVPATLDARILALQEAEDDAVTTIGHAGVIGHPGGSDLGDKLTVE